MEVKGPFWRLAKRLMVVVACIKVMAVERKCMD